MVSNITGNSHLPQTYELQQHQSNPQVHKNNQGDQEPQDSVVLSKQAAGTGDVDHDGDSH